MNEANSAHVDHEWLRIKDVAEFLSVTPRWVTARIGDGSFRAIRFSRGIYRVEKQSVLDWVEAHRLAEDFIGPHVTERGSAREKLAI